MLPRSVILFWGSYMCGTMYSMKLAKNQRIFLSYAWTGEDKAVVAERMRKLRGMFVSEGFDAYCNFDDPKTTHFTEPRQYLLAAIEELRACDVVLVVQASERRSEGLLIEVGAAMALGKQVVVAQHQSARGLSYLASLGVHWFGWTDDESLLNGAREML
jgi:hypothetical protein